MTASALIIGGGLAGSAAAIGLRRAGRSVVLIEREAGPHDKVCGEFLSHEANSYLLDLGVDVRELGSLPIDHVRIAHWRGVRTAQLPFPAQSLSRKVLDEALLGLAERSGAEVRRGVRATSLGRSGDGWVAALDGGERIGGRCAILATGKHDVRGWKRPSGHQPDLIGFKMYWRLMPAQMRALGPTVELALFPGGYAGLQPVEGGRANLCLLVRKSRFATLGQSWEEVLRHMKDHCSHLAQRLDGAIPLSDRPLAISAIPYGHVARAAGEAWRLGDQAAVIPSFSGDGMSIALHSARLAVDAIVRGEPAAQFQTRLHSDLAWQIGAATVLSKALVSRAGQTAAFAMASIFPRSMAGVAAATRISPAAMARVHGAA